MILSVSLLALCVLQVNEISWNKQNDQFFLTNGNGCVVILRYSPATYSHRSTARGGLYLSDVLHLLVHTLIVHHGSRDYRAHRHTHTSYHHCAWLWAEYLLYSQTNS